MLFKDPVCSKRIQRSKAYIFIEYEGLKYFHLFLCGFTHKSGPGPFPARRRIDHQTSYYIRVCSCRCHQAYSTADSLLDQSVATGFERKRS